MLDTIIYIPTILAYAFITLLVVILSFIVFYVSHKIYISIYENLPVAKLASSTISSFPETTEQQKSTHNFLMKNNTLSRKLKTALRIIVHIEPSYLAFIIFETEKLTRDTNLAPMSTRQGSQGNQLTKYYDRLSDIPMGKVMRPCPEKATRSNAKKLSDVIDTLETFNTSDRVMSRH